MKKITNDGDIKKITNDWNEINFEELEERLEMGECSGVYCQKNFCSTEYST